MIDTTNYFHKDGFIDKFGTFSSVMTGFYVASLVAVATFSTQSSALDEKIENGPVVRWDKVQNDNTSSVGKTTFAINKVKLTRREYLCQMFGYLATLSMMLTLIAIVAVIIVHAVHFPKNIDISTTKYIPVDIIRAAFIVGFSLPICHLVVTTTRGLWYLVDRLYDKKAVMLPKP